MKFVIITPSVIFAKDWIVRKRIADVQWAMNHPLNSDILIATRPEHLRGMNVEHGVLLEGWRSMPDIKEMLFLAMIHTQGTNLSLKKAYEEVEDKLPVKPTLRGKQITKAYVDEAAKLMADDIDKEVLKQLGINP